MSNSNAISLMRSVLIGLLLWLASSETCLAAFATVAASATSQQEGTNVTSHTVSLPSGIVDGNLLVLLACVDGTSGGGVSVTWPEGYSPLLNRNSSTNMGSPVRMAVAYRKANGGEGSTISFTTSNAQMSSHIVYRITGHHASDPPEGIVTDSDSALSTSVDPPELTASGGAEDNLWIAMGCADNASNLSAPTFPTDYDDNQLSTGTNGASGFSMMSSRELNAATENPGAYTIDTAAQRVGATVVVRPAGVGGGGAKGGMMMRGMGR